MSRNYDNWERLVEAVLDREKLRQLAREPSLSSCFSFDSTGLEAPNCFSYNELKKATRNFQPVRIVGGGGSLYDFKGWIDEYTLTAARPGFGLAITVKFMPKGFQGHDQWLSEVNLLGQLHHPNLVKLIGYCIEGGNRFLVYEFMASEHLEMHFFRGLSQAVSNWEARINIAIDVARALCFLHDRNPPVIHGHVRASTILLDEDFNAKLEVLSNEPDTHGSVLDKWNSRHPKLLLANHPDDYLSRGEVTTERDVYNFGVVLLQLLYGRHAFDRQRICGDRNLVGWAIPHLSGERKLFIIMDPQLRNQYSNEGARTLASIALQCLNTYPKLRPSMTKVLAALEQKELKSKSREYKKPRGRRL